MNACKLLKENNINFSIVTCIHSKNSDHDTLDSFLELSKKYNCEWRINWFKPTGRGKMNEELKLDSVDVHDIFRYIVERSIITALPDPYFSAIIGLNTRAASPCGIESFRITPNTEVVPCVYFTKKMENISILSNDFESVVNSALMKEVRNREVPFCKTCEFCKSCRGGCLSRAYLEYGSITEPDAFCFKKNLLPENPLSNLIYEYKHDKTKVHENYLCTLIVKAK